MTTGGTAESMHLDELLSPVQGLTVHSGGVLAEAAAVCLSNQGHDQGVPLQISGDYPAACSLFWQSVSEHQLRCYNDLNEATEKGACGIAILLVKKLAGLIVVERSRKGTGFDYWLGYSDDSALMSGKVRLEVSGILKGSKGTVERRADQKLDQIRPSDHSAPGIVGIVEFSGPVAHLVNK